MVELAKIVDVLCDGMCLWIGMCLEAVCEKSWSAGGMKTVQWRVKVEEFVKFVVLVNVLFDGREP